MIRVVVTGSECTGKTTLARALAAHYGTTWSPEYARTFVEKKGAPPVAADVDTIARGQMHGEDRAATRAAADGGGLVVLDTDLFSTLVYARHYYGSVPVWIEDAARERRGALYLLADIDVPWEADGLQRDRPGERELLQALFRSTLSAHGLPLIELRGPADRRLVEAIAAVDALLASA